MSRKGVPINKETKEKEKAAEKIVVEENETEEREQQTARQATAHHEPSMLDIWNLMQETNHQNLSMKINLEKDIAAMRMEMVARMDYLESRIESRRESRSSSPPKQTDVELSKLAETQLKITDKSSPLLFSE